MNKAYREMSFGILIAVAIFVAGFLLSACINHPPTKDTDAATWAGAMGTFCAFAGTIWLATRETARRNDEAKRLGQLTAVRFLTIAAEAKIRAEAVINGIVDNPPNGIDTQQLMQYEKILSSSPGWSETDLVPLIVLPNACALSLASARQGLDVVTRLFRLYRPDIPMPTDKTSEDFLTEAVGTLHIVIGHLDLALVECNAFVNDLEG